MEEKYTDITTKPGIAAQVEMRRCNRCGKVQPITEYWNTTWHDGTRHPGRICKACARAYKQEEYRKKRKKPDGIRLNAEDGRIYEHHGISRRIFCQSKCSMTSAECSPRIRMRP